MNLIPISSLSRKLVFLLKLQVAVMAVSILTGIYEYIEYSSVPEDTSYYDVYFTSDTIAGIVGLIFMIMAIIIGIVFLKWIYRVNKNLNTMSGGGLKFTPGWSIGWYFIPFANIYKPYQAMKEIYLTCKDNPDAKTSLLVQWWSFWILSSAVGQIVFRATSGAETVGDHLDGVIIYMFSDGIDILLNLIAIKLVLAILAAYRQNIDESDIDQMNATVKTMKS
ncbi:MAG: DUF4328 domain-containing protein [Verrucomicrobiota bacterium]